MKPIPMMKDEFIGKKVTITSCSDPTLQQVSGIIVDETKQTFHLEVSGRLKQVAKSIATFAVQRDNQTILVKGSHLTFRPENRIKKAR